MSYQELLQRMIGATLVALLLVGCGTPASTPAPVSPITTPTPVPPTVTPAPVIPTVTPTPVPPTDTPIPVSPTSTSIPAFIKATSIDDIVGTWYSSFKNLYLRFYEDGFLHQADSLDSLDSSPYAKCEIWFEETQMYLKEKEVFGVPSCGAAIGIYEVRLYPEDYIQIVKVKDTCSPRAGDTALKLDRVR